MAVAAVMAGAAAGVSVVSGINQARHARKIAEQQARVARTNAEFQRKVQEYNARVKETSASRVIEASSRNVAKLRRAGGKAVGRQRSATARRGFVVGQGSARDIMKDIIMSAERRESDILTEAAQRSTDLTNAALMDRVAGSRAEQAGYERAKIAISEGKASSQQALLGGFGKALGFGAQAVDAYDQWKLNQPAG